MEILKNKIENNYVVQYCDNTNINISISEIGLHDFHYIKPETNMRIQQGFTFHYIDSGEGTFTLGKQKYNLKKGDIFFTPAGTQFSTCPNAQNPWRYVWLMTNGKSVLEYFKKALLTPENPTYACQCGEKIMKIMTELFDECKNPNSFVQANAFSAWFKIISLLALERNNIVVKETSKFSKRYYVEKIIDFLENNYTNPEFKVESISEELHISHSYLCKLFKENSNMSIIQYLIQIRLREARVLLDNCPASIKYVAYSVGYNDYIHFAKEFYKYFNMTPGEYRKIQQQNLKNNKIKTTDIDK